MVSQFVDLFDPPPPPPKGTKPDISVAFVLSPRFSLMPFAGFIESLRHAADEADHSRQIFCSWRIVSHSLDPVMASCGIEVLPHCRISECEPVDYVIVVGGLLPGCLDLPPQTYAYIRKAFSEKISVVGLCTGSFILANAGLLDGHKCGIHFEHKEKFADLFPNTEPITDQVYVMDRGIITCPGGTAAISLACVLIEMSCGKARAIKGLTSLLVDKHRAAEHMLIRPYDHLTACGNWRVEQALQLMEQHFSAPYSIASLARRLCTTERQLGSAFNQHAGEPPSTVWRNIRLAHGHWLIANTSRTVTQIAQECGFSDGAHFSRWFKRTYGEPPATFRTRRRSV